MADFIILLYQVLTNDKNKKMGWNLLEDIAKYNLKENLNNRVDVMVDIETLGIQEDSTIFQISAAAFDINTGRIIKINDKGAIFDQYADITLEKDLKADGETIKWWLLKYPEMFYSLITKGQISPKQLLISFCIWLKSFYSISDNVHLWGNGVNFDNLMLKFQLDKLGEEYKYPIKYSRDRDYRTIIDLACVLMKTDRTTLNEKLLEEYKENNEFNPHNAMDDVLIQIYKLTRIINAIKKFDLGIKL